ncbi:MAG TPA: M48 family metalloprotease [Terriglobia bacterium]|nr:M48 family metalloprotease [Terriglobia bacterium]
MRTLLASPLGKAMPRLHYRLVLLDELSPNALSQANGTVSITAGLLPIFEGDRGVWAAVIGHELGHVLLAHPRDLPRFQTTLREAYKNAHASGYDHGPARWPDERLGYGLAKPKASKEQEYQADFIGLMLMADAGYQPGYSVILEKRLLFGLGSEPRFVAVFSHHPRLESREERTLRFSDIAMDIFRSRWPDAAKSPGGNLPPYGTIGDWTFEQSGGGGGQIVFHVPFQVQRSAGMKIRVAAFFLDGDLRVRSSEPKYRATDGSLVLNRFLPGAENRAADVTLQVPSRDLITRHHRLRAVVFLMAGSRPLDVVTRHVDVTGIDAGHIQSGN